MVKGKFISGQEDLLVIHRIRKNVFGEDQPNQKWRDIPDDKCMHVVAYSEETPAAAGSIYYDGWEGVIHHVAVLQECRGQGLGDFVVRMLIDRALMADVSEISADIPIQTKGFFEKIGFHETESNGEFQKENYIKMKLDKTDIHKCCDCHA